MTCTCNLAPSLWRQLRECCAALCQGREAYQHLLSHKPELSDSLGERAAPLPARSRTHPSSFRQVVPPSHLILGLETVGVISVPTRRPYRNHMASIKGACCCAWSPRESASSARRVVFFLPAYRPADSFYKFLARPKSEVPLPPPSFPLCRVRPFSWGRSRPGRNFHFSLVTSLVIDVLSASLPRDTPAQPDHRHELATCLSTAATVYRLLTFCLPAHCRPRFPSSLLLPSRLPSRHENSSRSPWTVLTHAAGLPRQKMMDWIRLESTHRGLALRPRSQISMTDDCRES
jgi:hypothetical protein